MYDAREEYKGVIEDGAKDADRWNRALALCDFMTKEELLFHSVCKDVDKCTLCLADTIRRGKDIFPDLNWNKVETSMEEDCAAVHTVYVVQYDTEVVGYYASEEEAKRAAKLCSHGIMQHDSDMYGHFTN